MDRGPSSLLLALFALLAGCHAARAAKPPFDGNAKSILYITLGASEEPTEVRAYEASAIPDPLLLPDGRYRVLAYDAPLVEIVAPPDASAHVTIVKGDLASETDWSLGPPDGYWELTADGFVEQPPAVIATWRTTFRVPRPPCAPAPTSRAITGLEGTKGVSFAVKRGDEVVLGIEAGNTKPQGVYRLDVARAHADPIPAFEGGSMISRDPPLGFLDGDDVGVLWISPTSGHYELATLDPSDVITERFDPTTDIAPDYSIEGLAGARFGATRTVVARMVDRVGEEGGATHLIALDEASRSWRAFGTTPYDASRACGGTGSLVLTVDAPGKGLAASKNGPIERFDLSLPEPLAESTSLVHGAHYCRAVMTTLGDGVEMITYSTTEMIDLIWRAPGGSWDVVPQHGALRGRAITSVGDTAITTGEGQIAVVFEHTPSRPDVPPRLCHQVVIGEESNFALAIDDHTILLAGVNGTDDVILAVLLDLPRR